MRPLLHWLVGIVIAMALVSCGGTNDETFTGTNDETYSSGVFFLSGGSRRAVGADVQVFPRQQTEVVAHGTTDQNGRPVVEPVADGAYSVKVTSSGQVVFLDSVPASQGRLRFVANDTLELPGTLSGIVSVQPQDDPKTVVVHVLGTDVWSNVDSLGRFRLEGLAQGKFRLQLATSLPDYQTTFPSPVRAWNDSDVVLPDTIHMLYTGIPVVQGITGRSDSSTGEIVLSWHPTSYRNLQRYLVFRDTAGALVRSTVAYGWTTDTFWRDTAASRALATVVWSYRVVVETKTGKPGGWFGQLDVTAVPPELSLVNKGSWNPIGRHHRGQLGDLSGKIAELVSLSGNGVLTLGVRSSGDGRLWDSGGVNLPLRKLGQTMIWVSGIGAGRIWCLGHSSIGDGIDVWSSSDGRSWSHEVLADSLWPASTVGLSMVGSPGRIALVVSGQPALVGESGKWKRMVLPSFPVGADDSVVYSTGGGSHLLSIPWSDASLIASDLGMLPQPLVAASAVSWNGTVAALGAGRLWVHGNSGWTVRGGSAVAGIGVSAGRLIVADSAGFLWIHEEAP